MPMRVALAMLLWGLAVAQQVYLNNAPITFSLAGTTQYVPSTGGPNIPGYTFNLGFDRYSWLGTSLPT